MAAPTAAVERCADAPPTIVFNIASQYRVLSAQQILLKHQMISQYYTTISPMKLHPEQITVDIKEQMQNTNPNIKSEMKVTSTKITWQILFDKHKSIYSYYLSPHANKKIRIT